MLMTWSLGASTIDPVRVEALVCCLAACDCWQFVDKPIAAEPNHLTWDGGAWRLPDRRASASKAPLLKRQT
ncbi:hypothetical protein BDV95DRAFT_562083 [Massariosphaeria phaeospora]|uniref:Uncharacterized protein n=1 Tax=Massariosphaeria phaeospora TaxID=100035 RepID=A0A7C8MRT5_9PLEO|nr:hypothetical protein BDV95DRAFT_562083 [Massariosphaeria phaeospora]